MYVINFLHSEDHAPNVGVSMMEILHQMIDESQSLPPPIMAVVLDQFRPAKHVSFNSFASKVF
jgi:hypothetical protein